MIIKEIQFKSIKLLNQYFLNKKINKSYKMSYVNFFADTFIDRCSDQRKNKDWVNEKLKLNQTNFILFHIDKPFVIIDEEKKQFNLCKLKYQQIEFLLNNKTNVDDNCTVLFLGLEYKRIVDENNNNNNNITSSDFINSKSPYLSPDSYDRESYTPWFAIETSNHDKNHQTIEKLFQNGTFLLGNFIRMMSMEFREEASLIAQVGFLLNISIISNSTLFLLKGTFNILLA
jgi:hypothetical protein